MGLDVLSRVHLFPVRHHSPRTSRVLADFLEKVKPRAVLVEGPSDADALVETLLDGETQPPVAILGYRTDGTPRSSLWPFASYSPEYVALKWAKQNGAKARFIDLTIGQALARDRDDVDLEDPADSEDEPQQDEPPKLEESIYERVAKARGYRSFEEFWEASFEAPGYDPDSFRSALLAYAELVRGDGRDVDYHRARDAVMAARIAEVAKEIPPEQIAVVVGAAHAAAFAAGDVNPELAKTLDATVPSAATLIPYSFPRLAEQTGYGAGNRAPQYYQRAHDAGCSFRRATLEVLVEFCEHLRLRGFTASLADTIEAYRLACTLADLRGKTEPGLDEVREATVATMCRGDASHVDGFLWPTVVGKRIGRVAARVGKNSLQEEFWRELDARKLPRHDEPETFVLKLNDSVQTETSVFLHRLRVAGVPYATFQGTGVGSGRNTPTEEAGGQAALARVREGWQAQWTPATDVALVEKIVLGDSLQQVCERVLSGELSEAKGTGDAAHVLMEAVVTGAPQVMGTSLRACDSFAATDEDLPSLAKACRALSGLVSFGTSRHSTGLGDQAVPALCTKTFARAVLRVRDGCTGDDEAVAPAKDALRALHEIALAQPLVDKSAWLKVARDLVDSYAVNAVCSGLACGLLYLAQEISDAQVADIVGQRLSNATEPEQAANFLGGFFEVNALVLVKSRPVVQALDSFLCGIDTERFRDALPMLRRAFQPLGATERRYLLENLLAIRKLGEKAKEAAQIVAEKDKAKLQEIAKDLGDLDDLL
ncbi:MAG: hypothetical protein JST54_15590 [Deltaproteobacteria bacterium]|nr:hypothetical protein [Deltaproteobacteria bacterium]